MAVITTHAGATTSRTPGRALSSLARGREHADVQVHACAKQPEDWMAAWPVPRWCHLSLVDVSMLTRTILADLLLGN